MIFVIRIFVIVFVAIRPKSNNSPPISNMDIDYSNIYTNCVVYQFKAFVYLTMDAGMAHSEWVPS